MPGKRPQREVVLLARTPRQVSFATGLLASPLLSRDIAQQHFGGSLLAAIAKGSAPWWR